MRKAARAEKASAAQPVAVAALPVEPIQVEPQPSPVPAVTPSPSPDLRDINPADLQLAKKASEKLKAGEQLTAREGLAVQRVQKWHDRQSRAKLYRAVPQGDLGEMCSGEGQTPKQCRQLQEMERQWGLPFAREWVNLYEFFPKLWEFLVKWGPPLRLLMEDDDTTGDGSNSLGVRHLRAKIAKTEEDARAAAIRNDLRQNTLIERERVHEVFERLVNVVRKASDRAQARWGQEGFDFIVGLIDGFEDEIRGVKDGFAFTDDPETADGSATSEYSGVARPGT